MKLTLRNFPHYIKDEEIFDLNVNFQEANKKYIRPRFARIEFSNDISYISVSDNSICYLHIDTNKCISIQENRENAFLPWFTSENSDGASSP
jgi:hypothetical protein